VPDDACSLLFTSGSTGRPKAILTRHPAMAAYIHAVHEAFAPSPADRVSQLAGLTFDFSMHDIILAWTAGGCLYAITPDEGYLLPTFIRDHGLTIWSSVPSTLLLMDRVHGLNPGSYPSVRLSLVGGEVVPPKTVSRWLEAAPNQTFYNIYGPTEAAMVVTACPWDDAFLEAGRIPIGRPLGWNRIVLVDDDLRPVPEGEEGEIVLGGPQVADGYYNDPERTAASFVTPEGAEGTWYRTGDQGRLDPTHGLMFLGRRDAQIQVRGHRLERSEAELMLRRAARTDDAAIVGWPIADDGILMGLVAFVDGSPLPLEVVRQRIRDCMPEYARPARIIQGPIPRNRNNKVDYTVLFDRLEAEDATSISGA
jgi:amino acid adenylation domain-containing protein